MSIYNDFSEIYLNVRNKAMYHIKNNKYIVEQSLNEFKINDCYMIVATDEIENEQYPFFNFWLEFSLGIEYLIKAVLIKHEVDIFTKKKGIQTSKYHELTGITTVHDDCEEGIIITANNNPWLNEILQNKEIKYVKQLSTGTLGSVNKKVKLLENKKIIDPKEKNLIEKNLKKLAVHRRNNDLHFYFKQHLLMENNDIIMDYIPLVNLLVKVYEREKK
jgi:hypothetical protein